MADTTMTDDVRTVWAGCHELLAVGRIADALRTVDDLHGGSDLALAERCRIARRILTEQILAQAEELGVTAAWTADQSSTVELSRLAGEYDAVISAAHARRLGIDYHPHLDMTDPQVRAVVYERYLAHGSQFDIYRWVNIIDLAVTLAQIDLPAGVRSDWERVIAATGLLVPPPVTALPVAQQVAAASPVDAAMSRVRLVAAQSPGRSTPRR